jgi:polysaccharide export outer membrane protein
MTLVLAACAGAPQPGGEQVRLVDASFFGPPDGSAVSQDARPYLIGPFDKLVIDVFGIDELSQKEVQTDASGRISFPLVGVVEASGKTPAQLERLLEDRLRAFVRDPQVTVNLKETVSQVVTVDGQVQEPGLYPVVGRMTLLRSIAKAKGTTEYAKADDVLVFRTVHGQRTVALFNLNAIRRGNYADPEIYANDVVVVGESQARRIFKDFIQIAPALTYPLVVALQH